MNVDEYDIECTVVVKKSASGEEALEVKKLYKARGDLSEIVSAVLKSDFSAAAFAAASDRSESKDGTAK
jgi:hypothetical protein